MNKQVAIIDYGLGNILSAQKSFIKVAQEEKLEAKIIITDKPAEVNSSTHIVLPGQGAFASCMEGLIQIPGMIKQLTTSVINEKKPFLGICVGMQLLANTSYENGKHKGLGWIDGEIKKLPTNGLKLPHMGWNQVKTRVSKKTPINLLELNDYYFVHSYYFECKNTENIAGETFYGINFASFVSKENIYGVQFHPEKSSRQGLDFIRKFLKL